MNYEIITAYRIFQYDVEGRYEQNHVGYVLNEVEFKSQKEKNPWLGADTIRVLRLFRPKFNDFVYFALDRHSKGLPIIGDPDPDKTAARNKALSKLDEADKKALGL